MLVLRINPIATGALTTAGGVVTITGSFFFAVTAKPTVVVYGTTLPATSITVLTKDSLACTLPALTASPGSLNYGNISITNCYASSSWIQFLYPEPKITSVSPATCPTNGQQVITIVGDNFGPLSVDPVVTVNK